MAISFCILAILSYRRKRLHSAYYQSYCRRHHSIASSYFYLFKSTLTILELLKWRV